MTNKELKEMFLKLTELAFEIIEYEKDFISLELSDYGTNIVVKYKKGGFSEIERSFRAEMYKEECLRAISIADYNHAVKVLTERIEELKHETITD